MYTGDTPDSVFVPVKLTGSKNYGMSNRSMRITIRAKRKLGFVLGTYKKESLDKGLHEQWETYNATVLSWIIDTVSEDLLNGIVYASNSYIVSKDIKKRIDKVNRMRIFQVHHQIANSFTRY